MTVPQARALLAAYGAPTLPIGIAAADARTRVRRFLGITPDIAGFRPMLGQRTSAVAPPSPLITAGGKRECVVRHWRPPHPCVCVGSGCCQQCEVYFRLPSLCDSAMAAPIPLPALPAPLPVPVPTNALAAYTLAAMPSNTANALQACGRTRKRTRAAENAVCAFPGPTDSQDLGPLIVAETRRSRPPAACPLEPLLGPRLSSLHWRHTRPSWRRSLLC